MSNINREWKSKEQNDENLKNRYSYWLVNFFSNIDERFIKSALCEDYRSIEKEQDVLTKVIKRVITDQNKTVLLNKDDIITGDKFDGELREIRDYRVSYETSINPKKENLLSEKDFEN